MSQIAIFGAGLAGLIAAKMLHEHRPDIYEKQDALPNNHSAVLRFRSSIVGDVTNIPFQKVKVIKGVHGSINPVADAVRYSLKVTGKLQLRSILDTDTVERYVAPGDLVSRLASSASICYGVDFLQWSNNLIKPDRGPIISTIPMPVMMDIFQWSDCPAFAYVGGWSRKMKIKREYEPSLHATMYYPGPGACYRATLCADELIMECMGEPYDSMQELVEVLSSFGLSPSDIESFGIPKQTRYQKIAELNRDDRDAAKRFIMWLSKEHQIYSLGRYATWRPKVMLDDLVQDVRIIRQLIGGSSDYDINLKVKA